jgi:hypothetical protein
MQRWWCLVLLGGGLVACGISAVGQLAGEATGDGGSGSSSGGGADGSSGTDGSTTVDGGAPCDAGASVVYLPQDGGACPTGTTEEIVQTDPQATADACSCGTCTPTADPSCNTGAISVSYSTSNASCNQDTLSYPNVPNATCIDFGFDQAVTQAAYERWPARTPSGGACTAASMVDQTKATATSLRRCVASGEAACLAPSATQKKCIESTEPCTGEYPVAITYGGAPTVACSACGCTRGATGCVVEHFSDVACTDVRYQQALDGLCQRTDDATNVRYFEVRAIGLTCVATAGTPTVTLTNPRTLCCTP